jgi:ankyrin repeat protein
LHQAAACKDPRSAQLLAERGADVDALNRQREAPMHKAVESNRSDVVLMLVAAGASIPDTPQTDTVLHVAARLGYTDITRILLQNGVDPNVTDERNKTSLHVAVSAGHQEVAQVLLGAGANVNAQDRPGNTPLHEAAASGHIGAVQVLLSAGANINARDDRGRTPLHEAARKGRVEAAKYLVDAGAQVNLIDSLGQTPLDTAQSARQWGVATILFNHCVEGSLCKPSGRQDYRPAPGLVPASFGIWNHADNDEIFGTEIALLQT